MRARCGRGCGRIRQHRKNDTLHANERLSKGQPLAGVIFVRDTLPVSKVIEDVLTILGASEASEWENRTDFLPL